MSDDIRESDWKLLRQLKPIALERFCERVLAEMNAVAAEAGKSGHERYLAVFKLMTQRDDELTDAFNELRRSTALQKLGCMRALELLTDEELSRFSPEARERIQFLVGIWRR
jgi:hypothetical protein